MHYRCDYTDVSGSGKFVCRVTGKSCERIADLRCKPEDRSKCSERFSSGSLLGIGTPTTEKPRTPYSPNSDISDMVDKIDPLINPNDN